MATYIAHHGILGMKWGIRRYQNKDGTLTEEGKKRYGVGEPYDPDRPTPEQDLAEHNRRVKSIKKAAVITGTTALAAYIVSPKVRAAVNGAIGKIGKKQVVPASEDEITKYAKEAASDALKNAKEGLSDEAKTAIKKAAESEITNQLSEASRNAVKGAFATPAVKEGVLKTAAKNMASGAKEGVTEAPKKFAKVVSFGLVSLGLKEVTDIIGGRGAVNKLYTVSDKDKYTKPTSWQDQNTKRIWEKDDDDDKD